MENNNKIKASVVALLIAGTLSVSNSVLAVANNEAKINRQHQAKKEGLHQKYKERHHADLYMEHKPTKRVRDIDLVTDDSSVANNSLLRCYMKKILEAKGDEKTIEKYIWLIKDLPGYDVEYDFRPFRGSYNREDVELILKIHRTKAKLSLETSNYGVDEIGRYQFVGTGQVLNPFGWNDSYVLSLGTSNRPSSLFLVTGGYNKKLGTYYGTEFSLLGSYLQDDAFREQGFTNTKDSKANYFRGEVTQPIIATNRNGLDVGLGIDHREVDNFGATGSKISAYDYETGFIFVKGRHRDFLKAENTIAVHYYNTLDNTNIDVLDPAERSFDRSFGFWTVDYYRHQPMSAFFANNKNKFIENLSCMVHILGHYSSDSLPIENQFYVGGSHQGKGFRPGLISSDKGIILYKEIRYNHEMHNKFLKRVQPYIFQEGAYISKPRDTINKRQFYSAGAGVRLGLVYDIFADLEVAAPFKKDIIVAGVKRDNPVRFNALLFKEVSF